MKKNIYSDLNSNSNTSIFDGHTENDRSIKKKLTYKRRKSLEYDDESSEYFKRSQNTKKEIYKYESENEDEMIGNILLSLSKG